METIAVIGAGPVGQTLAAAWVRAGHQVAVGSRNPAEAPSPAGAAVTGPHAAIEAAHVVVYTIPGAAMPDVLTEHAGWLAGRVVIDATNNMSPDRGGPELNALRHLPGDAIGFRAFNSVGWENMADPVVGGEVADMFFAGPDSAEREIVSGLIGDVGFRPVYVGAGPAALAAVDSLAALWFALVFGRGHGRRLAFRVLTDSGSV
jgi:8-hydroxy-5-deazaflavin:NADPH oxidoreductase